MNVVTLFTARNYFRRDGVRLPQAGGDQNGSGKRVASYTVNDLNQYTQRDVPGGFDVFGVARGTVTVNGNSTYRKGEYFRNEVSVSNGSTPQYQSVSVNATDGTSVSDSGNVFVAKTPEVFGYDLDGNLTNDGRWVLTWDGENRLIKQQSLSGAPVNSSNRLTFAYDHQGRRIQKVSEVFTNGAWTTTLDHRFAYDGWNLLAAVDSGNALQKSWRWGIDLSGSLQGAGGVGGLISMTVHTGGNSGVSFHGYDGNGNVALLVSAATGSASANHEYDPFGRLLRSTGPLALLNPFRFSTKYQDDESVLLYYGYRFHDPSTGRWLSRDPMEEKGGANLYAFVRNYPIALWDYLGKGLEAGFIFAGDITYDLCQGTLSIGGWVWAGAGYELWGVYVGPSYYWQGSYTMTGLPHLQCGKCKCCGEHAESGWNAGNIGNIVGPYLGHLGASKNIGIGFIVTPELPCGAEFEAIALVDLLKSGMGGPIITGLRLVAGVLGAEVSAGFDVHVSVHACQTNIGEGIGGSGLTIDSAKIGGGGFVEIGWIPDDMKNRPRH